MRDEGVLTFTSNRPQYCQESCDGLLKIDIVIAGPVPEHLRARAKGCLL